MLRRFTIVALLGALAVSAMLPVQATAHHGPRSQPSHQWASLDFSWSCAVAFTGPTGQTLTATFRHWKDVSWQYEGEDYGASIVCTPI